jgi:hypothetical protein
MSGIENILHNYIYVRNATYYLHSSAMSGIEHSCSSRVRNGTYYEGIVAAMAKMEHTYILHSSSIVRNRPSFVKAAMSGMEHGT